jgi:hypothetical protein
LEQVQPLRRLKPSKENFIIATLHTHVGSRDLVATSHMLHMYLPKCIITVFSSEIIFNYLAVSGERALKTELHSKLLHLDTLQT